ncbi:MAG: DUF4430 domain-containing protein [Clostridia bacterium]|nr:DUF4430 domain-containing protein [Clostridia bacterium]
MKKRNLILRVSSLVITLALIAAMALCMTSCGKTATADETSSPAQTTTVKPEELGEGATQFNFSVTDADGKTSEYVIKTDKTMLGDALLEAGIIPEEEQKTGFINTVNGVTLNWDTDKAYWALYVGDGYAEKGVNETEITAGGKYSFVYTKG